MPLCPPLCSTHVLPHAPCRVSLSCPGDCCLLSPRCPPHSLMCLTCAPKGVWCLGPTRSVPPHRPQKAPLSPPNAKRPCSPPPPGRCLSGGGRGGGGPGEGGGPGGGAPPPCRNENSSNALPPPCAPFLLLTSPLARLDRLALLLCPNCNTMAAFSTTSWAQKWPQSIFPFVNFIVSEYKTSVQGRGSRGVEVPPPTGGRGNWERVKFGMAKFGVETI